MRKALHSLNLLLLFLTLAVGSSVTFCQAASFVGIDLHGSEVHGHEHECHHGVTCDEETPVPCGEKCAPVLDEAATTPTLNLPELTAFGDVIDPSSVSRELRSLEVFSKVVVEPSPPPSPPLPVLTGRFLI